MKRLPLALAMAAVAFLTVPAPSVAQNYSAMTCTVSAPEVTGGEDVTVTALASPDVPSTWTLSYDGQTANRSGNPVTASFDTDEVDQPMQTTVTATVTQGEDSMICTGTIYLQPRDGDGDDGDGDGDGDGNGGEGGDNGGLLPNTGGERLAWLIIGAMLVLAGGGVIVASRSQDT